MGVEGSQREGDILKHVEFETKYEVESDVLFEFKDLAESLNPKKFIYVEGPDTFFTITGRDDIFARYRRATHGDGKRAEFTVKEKHSENNNIIRTETNWRVDNTSREEVVKGAELMGFKLNTEIFKTCHIYNYNDATLVYYSVREGKSVRHFIEIEVSEGLELTEDESWDIIKKYEELLSPLGISAQRRKRLSLFEMYRRDL